MNSSSDEVTAVFNLNGNDHSILRLSEVTPVSGRSLNNEKSQNKTTLPKSNKSNKASYLSDSSNFDDQLIEIDADENVKNSTFITRRDSRNNMLNNTDTDDDMIVI